MKRIMYILLMLLGVLIVANTALAETSIIRVKIESEADIEFMAQHAVPLEDNIVIGQNLFLISSEQIDTLTTTGIRSSEFIPIIRY